MARAPHRTHRRSAALTGLGALACCILLVLQAAPARAAGAVASPWIASTGPDAASTVPGWHLTPRAALSAAERAPQVHAFLAGDPHLTAALRALAAPGRTWEILWSQGSAPAGIAYVDDESGRVAEFGTGIAVRLAGTIPLDAWGGTQPIPGQTLIPRQVIALALRSPQLLRALRSHPGAVPAAMPTTIPDRWRIDWFEGTKDTILVYFNPRTRRVTNVFTGRALAWAVGRGDPIYTGDALSKWWVWAAFCLLFLVAFIDPRRPLRLLHLDLVALLGFSLSSACFDRGDLSASVPLIYPIFAYLFVRLLLAGLRPRAREGSLVPLASDRLLLVGTLALTVARIVLNVTGSTPLDVGTASYTGAQQIVHGLSPYAGSLGQIVPGGDTYGPVTYLAYIPFALAFPHTHGIAYPGAHAAAIFYDLLTTAGLFVLGRRLRGGPAGRRLGLALSYAWVAFPYTAFTLMENTNDALVALIIVLTLLVLSSPARRGFALALAAMTKFFPLVLVPMVGRGAGSRPVSRGTWLTFGAGLVGGLLLTVLPFAHSPSGLRAFYHLTLGYQFGRTSPLSIWGQYPALVTIQRLLEAGTIVLALALAVWPRRRSPAQVAALCACLIIATEACASYWYYTYIVWFAPAAFLALFLQYRSGPVLRPREDESVSEPELIAPARPRQPATLVS